MKFLIVFACLCVLALANEQADVVSQKSDVNPESFNYAYQLSNHISAEQSGVLKDKDNWVVHGEYEYVSKDGKNIKVTYTADEHGYHPHVQKS